MIRKILLAVFIVLLVVGGLAGVKALQFRKLMAAGKSFAPPPESVSSAVVREEKWQGTLTAIGSDHRRPGRDRHPGDRRHRPRDRV